METQEHSSRTITATFSVSQEHSNLTEGEIRELISSNAPEGFTVKDVELEGMPTEGLS